MTNGTVMAAFITGLKSRNDDVRLKTAHDLHHFVTTELREMQNDQQGKFLDDFVHYIFEMVSSNDVHERKGGILAIASLIGVDVGNTSVRMSRFTSYLKNLLPSNDTGVMEMAAEAVGSLALVSGTAASEFVEFEVKRSLEWLQMGERHEAKRHAAVLILKQLAWCTPTFFFQQIQPFFDCIFNAVRDIKPAIRESAVAALRAALTVTSQRETKSSLHSQWYKQCFEECQRPYDETQTKEKRPTRDDWAHASLLVLNELLRCSNIEGERLRIEMEDITSQQYQHQGKGSQKSATAVLQHLHHQSAPLSGLNSLQRAQQHKRVLVESRMCKEMVNADFDLLCGLVMKHRGSKAMFVQQTLLTVIPRLASFSPHYFSEKYLAEVVTFLLAILRTSKDRSQAFHAVGLLAVSVKGEITRYLPRIMDIIKTSLPSRDLPFKKQRSFVVDPAIFTCISMLARAVQQSMMSDVKDLLEPIMAVGLSPSLTASLRDLANHIPQLKKDIQDGLLKMLSVVLMGRPLRSAAPTTPTAPLPASASNQSLVDTQDHTSITLALRTLGSFDFQGLSLTPFVRHCADIYLSSDNKDIRMEAVRTCAHLLTPLLNLLYTQPGKSVAAMNTVAEVLNKLLIVGITDSDSDIRYCVLVNLDERFDPHLAQAENLSALFVSLNDEIFEIRELAICVIARLSNRNPAYVMPSLRKILIQILTELEHSGVGRNKEQAACMLRHLVANSPRLVRPYMSPIIKVLIPMLKEADANPGVTVSVLAALGEQAQVSCAEMSRWIDELLPIILELLQDSSSVQKREVALHTLGQLVESTGYVVEPYRRYPNLLEILLNFLKMEQSPNVRREVLRVLGRLGALDPHKHKMNLGLIGKAGEIPSAFSMTDSKTTQDLKEAEYNTSEMLVSMGANTTLKEFYPAIAIATLLRIIRDPTFSQYHHMVVQANAFIFKHLGIKCVPYIQQVVPAYLIVIRTANFTLKEFLLQHLGLIIAIVKQHIRNYLDDIFDVIKDYWTPDSPLQNNIILLIQQIVAALGTEFKHYLPQIIPQILRVFMQDSSANRNVTEKLLNALQLFGATLDDYLHLLLPPVVKLFDSSVDAPLAVRRVALETISIMTDKLDLTDFASRIIHPLVRTLDTTPELRPIAMDTLCALAVQLGHKFTLFTAMVGRELSRHKIEHENYNVIITKIIKTPMLSDEDDDPLLKKYRNYRVIETPELTVDTAQISTTYVSLANLQKSLTAGRRVSKEDWAEWLRRLSIELLKESPSPALRSCFALAQTYPPLARDLFNAAFVSCWTDLSEVQQDDLIANLEQALTSQDQAEITQTLLNLAEFMEHCDEGPLPMDTTLLRMQAMRCQAYAKALHYTEEEFHRGPKTETLESLITINNKLQQPEAAAGVLHYAKLHHRSDLKIQESWYEKLHEWTKALNAYEARQEINPRDIDLTLGRMRCLDALADWGQLSNLASDHWPSASEDTRRRMARMAAASAWGLGKWDSMEEYISMIPRASYDGAFYRAVFALHQDNYTFAQQCIEKARDIIDNDLTAMAGESYNRAYGALVNVQMLSELEEVMQYKLLPERQPLIREMWWHRLQGCQRNSEDWQKFLQVRSLVMSPQDDMRSWLKYASLCRKTGHLPLSHKTLVMLLDYDPALNKDASSILHDPPQVTFAYIKHMWKTNKTTEALKMLQDFVEKSLSARIMRLHSPEDAVNRAEMQRLVAKCELKLGAWTEELRGITETSIPGILSYYYSATQHDKDWYKTWHAWALMNYEVVLFYKQKEQDEQNIKLSLTSSQIADDSTVSDRDSLSNRADSTTSQIHKYCIPAVHGFFQSIALSSRNSLQDTLRLLTLWFDYGHWVNVYEALVDRIGSIQIDNWLQVIPQLIARIDTPRHLVARLITQLLIDIGKAHPQALIYPLTVASKSSVITRHTTAKKVLKSMREHSDTLVQQAILVSEELIRVAILWHELWHEGLEEASRLYFGERNTKGMFDTLEPLHAMMEDGPKTLKETSFHQAYGRDLMEAQECCKKYQRSGNVKDLTQAWDLYYVVFRRISKQLPQLTALELQYVSPALLQCQDLELAVPGTYDPSQPLIRIHKVQSTLHVIASKQRPRKLSIYGSNGQEYIYLLKGHEDLRQDERVMQLFGLVNSLLLNHPETFTKNLSIQRYAIIPLSTNSGLIGWVPHCDTLHSLIRDYREKKKILLNIEHRLMLRMAPDYEHLTLMQKVEVFEHALEHTQGDDLAKILWYKSPSSEVWFDRRTNYTRSLAVMSMVGYILGLGDRHPSNLMLDRMSGKITHIDFGDCFDVAMTREKFPEKIPFRLTRMLISAMEVTGIEGNYRMTCESVLDMLRQHRDSVMAVLEAFVYDPLLNWRLLDVTTKTKGKSTASGQEQGDLLDSSDIPTHRSSQPGHSDSHLPNEGDNPPVEAVNKKAIQILTRVRDKLTGRDFQSEETKCYDVPAQVDLLIQQATSHENLCQCYIGWCPFW